jgi:hypothetical protein
MRFLVPSTSCPPINDKHFFKPSVSRSSEQAQ